MSTSRLCCAIAALVAMTGCATTSTDPVADASEAGATTAPEEGRPSAAPPATSSATSTPSAATTTSAATRTTKQATSAPAATSSPSTTSAPDDDVTTTTAEPAEPTPWPTVGGEDFTGGPLTELPDWEEPVDQGVPPAEGAPGDAYWLCDKPVGVAQHQISSEDAMLFGHGDFAFRIYTRVAQYAPGGVEKALAAHRDAVTACPEWVGRYAGALHFSNSTDDLSDVSVLEQSADTMASYVSWVGGGNVMPAHGYWVTGSGNTTVEVMVEGAFTEDPSGAFHDFPETHPMPDVLTDAAEAAVRAARGEEPGQVRIPGHRGLESTPVP